MPKIFISHAHADKKLVEEFVEFILYLGCGVPQSEIFCTSYKDKGVTPGKDFINEIKENLKNTSIVILMISPNYYESQFCLGELGATWIIKTDLNEDNSQSENEDDDSIIVFPMRINLTEDKVKALLQVSQIRAIDDRVYLAQLYDIIKKKLATDATTPIWDKQCTAFLNKLPALLKSLEKPRTIPYSDHEKLQQELAETNRQLNQRAIEIERLLEQIARLEKAKDKEEVEKIKAEFSTESEEEKLERLLEEAKKAFGAIPNNIQKIVGIVLFYGFSGFYPARHTIREENHHYIQLANSAIAKKYIEENEVNDLVCYTPNKEKLGTIIEKITSFFKESDIALDDAENWDHYLGIKIP